MWTRTPVFFVNPFSVEAYLSKYVKNVQIISQIKKNNNAFYSFSMILNKNLLSNFKI